MAYSFSTPLIPINGGFIGSIWIIRLYLWAKLRMLTYVQTYFHKQTYRQQICSLHRSTGVVLLARSWTSIFPQSTFQWRNHTDTCLFAFQCTTLEKARMHHMKSCDHWSRGTIGRCLVEIIISLQGGPPTSYKQGHNSTCRGNNPSYPFII